MKPALDLADVSRWSRGELLEELRRYQAWLQYLAGQVRGSARHWSTVALLTPVGSEPAWPPTWKKTPAGWRRA